MPQHTRYPIGTPGIAWQDAERQQWRQLQHKKRDYFTDVVSPLMRLGSHRTEVFSYGSLDYRRYGGTAARYPLYAVKSVPWVESRPLVLVTGGVHGYETSGVHGALQFILGGKMDSYQQKEAVNLLVLPCISPWGYETINRWTPEAVDPNRCFVPLRTFPEPGKCCGEAANAIAKISMENIIRTKIGDHRPRTRSVERRKCVRTMSR